MGPLMGTNKAAWGVKVETAAGDRLGNTEHTALLFVSLWMVLPAFGFPPAPNARPPTPYIIHP